MLGRLAELPVQPATEVSLRDRFGSWARSSARSLFIVLSLLLLWGIDADAALRPRARAIKPATSTLLPGDDPLRLCVKFVDGLEVDLDAREMPAASAGRAFGRPETRALLKRLREAGGAWHRGSRLDRTLLRRLRARAETSLGREIADLSTYYFVTLPPGGSTASWLDSLNALPEVELAAPSHVAAPPPSVPDYEPLQGYLGEAPEGLGAQFIWTIPGGTGEGVGICDLEYDWNLAHEDLPSATVLVPDGDAPYDLTDDEHGTAVLGEMFALRNGWGVTGASYGARCYLAPAALLSGAGFFEQLLYATSRMEPGDVLLIELGTVGPYCKYDGTPNGMVPIEWESATYNAILTAVGNGIHVVEPAGNGNEDLDDPVYAAGNYGHAPFLRENDSGAIMVGAGAPPISPWRGPDRGRLVFSNYGSRLDLQGWGVDVPTTGIGDLYSAEGPNRSFSKTFGGTSAAAPNIASAVASIEGIVERRTGRPVDPLLMRRLLVETGSPQVDGLFPASQSIGPRPDLRAAYARLDTPLVCSPDTVLAFEGDTLRFVVSAADFDGDAIVSLSAAPLPPGAGFNATTDNTRGAFEWCPGRGDAGTYDVVFTASNDAQSTATTRIVVRSWDRGPIVTGPGGVVGFEAYGIEARIEAIDPNGDAIDALTARGLPAGATFTPDSTNASGLFAWTPSYAQAGQYVVTFAASSRTGGGEPLEGICPFVVTVLNVDRPPIVTAPSSPQGKEAEAIVFEVTASDPDGEAIESLVVEDAPPGSEFTVSADHQTGTFQWTPSYAEAGSYRFDFYASNARYGSATVTLRVGNNDRPPVVNAPTAVAGTEGEEISFDVAVSDPDQDGIASFGSEDLPEGAKLTLGPSRLSAHFAWSPTLGQAGTYEVTLIATSRYRGVPLGQILADTALVTLTIERGLYPAGIYVAAEDRTIRLASGKPTTRVWVEPSNHAFSVADIDQGTIRMSTPGGESSIPGTADLTVPATDHDGNGIEEVALFFTKTDLRSLFASPTEGGEETRDVTIEGRFLGGGSFRGQSTLRIVSEDRLADARVTPNPARGGATLSFRAPAAGHASVRVYDVHGRLVRVAFDGAIQGPGYVDVRMVSTSGRDPLPSGIYFYRLQLPGGDTRGRFALLK